MFDSIQKSGKQKMLDSVHKLLDEADAIVHYNGSRFDIPILHKEFLLAGMPPPAPAKQIDLLQVARRQFRFVSNKLDYVSQALGLGSKTDSVSGAGPEDKFNYVTMLLHGDGTNGAQNNTFIDSSTNNFSITRNGNTTQGSFSPYGSNWSNYFSGTSGQYINAPANTAFNFGTGDFTVEGWVYPTTTSGTRPIVEIRTSAANSTGFALLSQSGATTLNVYTNGGFAGASTNSLTTNQWNHVALTRSGNTWGYWINGVASGSFTNSSTQSDGATTGPKIGGSTTGGEVWIGYMSNIRIVKGTAVYTTAFTPSTTPLTAISGTSLLTSHSAPQCSCWLPCQRKLGQHLLPCHRFQIFLKVLLSF